MQIFPLVLVLAVTVAVTQAQSLNAYGVSPGHGAVAYHAGPTGSGSYHAYPSGIRTVSYNTPSGAHLSGVAYHPNPNQYAYGGHPYQAAAYGVRIH